jgi:hypothetical protein
MQRRSLASQSLDGVDSCFIIRALLGLALIVLGFVRSYRTSALKALAPVVVNVDLSRLKQARYSTQQPAADEGVELPNQGASKLRIANVH